MTLLDYVCSPSITQSLPMVHFFDTFVTLFDHICSTRLFGRWPWYTFLALSSHFLNTFAPPAVRPQPMVHFSDTFVTHFDHVCSQPNATQVQHFYRSPPGSRHPWYTFLTLLSHFLTTIATPNGATTTIGSLFGHFCHTFSRTAPQ